MHLGALKAFDECGDECGVAAVLEALAGLSIAQELGPHAARLLGAASAMRQAAGCLRSPLDEGRYAEDVALARAALSVKQFDQEWARGAALSRADALTLAVRSRGGRRRAAAYSALTPTEQRVSKLVAERLTNHETAERLFISRRTAEGHVARVFAKLGVTSRRQFRDLMAETE